VAVLKVIDDERHYLCSVRQDSGVEKAVKAGKMDGFIPQDDCALIKHEK
jgi:hypothetical protein